MCIISRYSNSLSFHGVNKLFIPLVLRIIDDHLFPRYTLLHDSCLTLMQRRIQLTNNYIIPNYCYEARNDRSSFQERYERLSKRSQHASPTGPGNSHVASSTPLSKATSATACHSSPSFRHTGHECTNPSENRFTPNVYEQAVIDRLEQRKGSSLFLLSRFLHSRYFIYFHFVLELSSSRRFALRLICQAKVSISKFFLR